MTKFWIICALAAALGGCASGGGVAFPAMAEEQRGVAGEWWGNYTGAGADAWKFYMTLKQEGERVTGTVSNPGFMSFSPPITDRPVSGIFRDGVLTIGPFSGKVTGNTWSGKLRSTGGPILDFSATRVK